MSTSDVVRKRGRPKKVVEETASALVADPPKKTTARKTPTKASKAAPLGAVEEGVKGPGKEAGNKVVKKGKATVAGKGVEVLKPAATVVPAKQATPLTPSSSKILQEVAAKGTFKTSNTPSTVVPNAKTQPPASSTPSPRAPAAQPPLTLSSKPSPTASIPSKPTSTSTQKASTLPNTTTSPPQKTPQPPPSASAPKPQIATKSTPLPTPAIKAAPKPISPPKAPSKPTPTPLPYRPSRVPPPPNPYIEPKPSRFAPPSKPAPPPSPPPPSSAPAATPTASPTVTAPAAPSTAPPTSNPVLEGTGAPHIGKEPLPVAPLPKKYRGAAFRVTAIMCAMPIVIVTGYELYGRFFLGKERKILPRVEPLPPAIQAAAVDLKSEPSPSS